MEFGPIWRALLQNKTSYLLIALQIAVTMAIMVNAIGIIQERSILMTRPSGVDEDNLFYLNSTGFTPDTDYQVLVAEDLAAIRNFPGVRNAVSTNTLPLQGGGWSQGMQIEPGEEIEKTTVALFFMDEHGIDTFGVNLIAGRNFTPTEVNWYDPKDERRWPPQIIVSKAMAEEFFPDFSPEETVGKIIYIENDLPLTVIGVMERLQAPWKSWSGVERTMLVPQRRGARFARYVIRTEPGYRDEVIPQIEKMLAESNTGRIIRHTKTMDEVRARSYLQDSAMIKLLIFIVSLLTAITSLGIVGLASFSVARRTKQIGTRRALGATRLAIQRYFMLENFLISSVGVIGGAILAVGLNIWMVQTFELAPIAWYLVPAAMLSLWIIGQLAVYGPARRASMVSPAVATRAV
ncbi:MAG: ABC transporter permease [Gammaproteobacteria bacterium]|nr:ABC transporter permease [Gammaproteobacteria bacterium]